MHAAAFAPSPVAPRLGAPTGSRTVQSGRWPRVVALVASMAMLVPMLPPVPWTSAPVRAVEATVAAGAVADAATLEAAGLALAFSDGSASIAVDGAAGTVELTTTTVGEVVVGDVAVTHTDGEVTSTVGAITEWYRVVPEGFEHGYTISEPVTRGTDLEVVVEVRGAQPIAVGDRDARLVIDDGSSLSYRGLLAFDATGRDLPAALRVEGGVIYLDIDTTGATYPITIDPIIEADQVLRDGGAGAAFGSAVAIDGDRMAVGGPGVDNPAAGDDLATEGRVFLFQRSGPGAPWQASGELVNPSPLYLDFGSTVALLDDQVAVGAPGIDGGPGLGVVLLYSSDGVGWGSPDVFGAGTGSGEAGAIGFGRSIAFVEEDRLVVGAPSNNGGEIFEYDRGIVRPLPVPTGAAPLSGDEFGTAVAVGPRPGGGLILVVGAPEAGEGSGAVYRFEDTGSGFTWVQRSSGYSGQPGVGSAVAVTTGRYVAAGYGDGEAGSSIQVHLSEWDDVEWVSDVVLSVPGGGETAVPLNGYLAIEGGTVAVGSPGGGGVVNLFRFDGAGWSSTAQRVELEFAGREPGDLVGAAVALEGGSLAAGAPRDDGVGNANLDAGAVYLAEIPLVATFTRAAGGELWSVPEHWDIGLVPGDGDTAIVPEGTSAAVAGGSFDVARVILSGNLSVGSEGSLRIAGTDNGPSRILPSGTMFVERGGQFELAADLQLAGQLVTRAENDGLPAGSVILTGETMVGNGLVANSGVVMKSGPAVLTVGPGVTWNSGEESLLAIEEGQVTFQGSGFDPQGRLAVDAGAVLELTTPVALAETSEVDIEIIGPATSTVNHGQLRVPAAGTTLDGLLRARIVGHTVAEDERFPIIVCPTGCQDGAGRFRQYAATSGGRSLDLVQEPDAYRLGIVADKVISDRFGFEGFGTSIDVDGDWAVVGETSSPTGDGWATVVGLDPETGTWEVTQQLVFGIGVGTSVAIDGDFATATAPGDNETVLYGRLNAEAPFTLRRSYVGGSGAIALAGNILAVGRPDASPPSVQLFDVTEISSVPIATVLPDGPTPVAGFGRRVALGAQDDGGLVLAVGVPADPGGDVYVFATAEGTWDPGPAQVITVPAGEAGADFGSDVAVSGLTLVVGHARNSSPIGDAGAAFVYEGQPGSYTLTTKLQAWDGPGADPEPSDTFGTTVAVDDGVIVVGAPAAQRSGYAARDGASYVFERIGTSWTETDAQRAEDGFDGEFFGAAVALSGDALLVGAPRDNNANGAQAGAVYAFEVQQDVPDPVVPPTDLSVQIEASTPDAEVGVSSIAIADLPATASQGFGGPTADYARSDLQTLDLRADLAAPGAAVTPIADVTLGQLRLDETPITRRLLDTILLSDMPIVGGWSARLAPDGPPLVEHTLTLLDVYETYGTADDIRLGDLSLQANTLGAISTYAVLLAGVPVDRLPVPDAAQGAEAFWCGLVADADLDCARDLGVSDPDTELTLPALSFAGVDVERARFLGAPIAGTDLGGTPIGDLTLRQLDIGVVPLWSQPLVPSRSLPSYLPATVEVPDAFREVTLGELGAAAPLAALSPEDLGLAGRPLNELDLTYRPVSPLQDYLWVPPAAGASLLLQVEDDLPDALASVPLANLGLDLPVLAAPLDELVLPNGRAVGDYRLVELLGGEAEFGAAPFAASPFAASPFGASPFAASPFAASPFGASPFAASPFGASPFGASPFAASPFAASPFGASPFAASPFAASPFAASPFGASPFAASPFAASPFAASPFAASPFGASPFGASPFAASPFAASPFAASPLSELGLAAPVTAIPLVGTVANRSLGSYELSDLDPASLLFDLPIQSFIDWNAFDCGRIDCRQPNGFTIADALTTGALDDDLTLADVQPGLFGLTIANLVGAHPDLTEDALRRFVEAIELTLGEASNDSSLRTDGIPIERFEAFEQATISDLRLLFSGWRLVDLGGLAVGLETADLEQAVADWAAAQANGQVDVLTLQSLTRKLPVAQGGLGSDELWADTLALSTIAGVAPALTVADVWSLLRPLRLEHLKLADGRAVGLSGDAPTRTLGAILGDGEPPLPSRLEGLLWGDLIGSAGTQPLAQVDDLTVAGVVGGFAGITLGEFLRAAQPISDQRTEQFDLRALDLADYASGATQAFDVDVEVVGGNRPQSVRLVVTLPEGGRYVAGSAVISEGSVLDTDDLEPTRFGDTLVWQVANLQPDTGYTLTFEVRSAERIGTSVTVASAQINAWDLFARAQADITYTEAFEPNDTPEQADDQPRLTPDRFVLSQIATPGDVDLFAFEVDEPGTRIGAVLWNLPADYDLTIIGPSPDPLAATGGRILESVGDGGSDVTGQATTSTLSDAGRYDPPDELAVIARSTRRGTAPEVIDPIPTFATGTYYLVVTGYDGASSDEPYALRLLRESPRLAAPACDGIATTFPFDPAPARPVATSIPEGADVLFVVNDARFARQYGAADADAVLAAIGQLTDALDGDLAGLGLTAGVLDLGSVEGLPYAAWDERPCDLAAANDVVRATVRTLDAVYADHPGLEYVVMVGSDRIIPFARLADRTLLGNEQAYAATFGDELASPLYAALHAGTYLSDDPYVDTTPNLVNDRALYVAERSVGRLVEDTGAIIGQLETFVERGGTVRVDEAIVTGYDFLTDSSEAIAELLGGDDGPIEGDVDTLISEVWDAEEFRGLLFPENGTGTGIGAINGHFSHQGAQSALGSATGDQSDALFVEDLGDTDFTGTLLFTVGCHSGLSVSEEILTPLGVDWAESFAAAGASAYLAQTGFGYGSTDSIQLTERLLVTFASRLDGNYTIGEALTLAKNDYVAPLASISVYDEKSLQQAVLFGLPFATPAVDDPPSGPSAPVDLTVVPTDVEGLFTSSFTVDIEPERLLRQDRPRGTVWELDGRSWAPPGLPLQPVTTVDSTAPGLPLLRGAILRGGTASLIPGLIDPVHQTPTIGSSEREPELQSIDAVYPLSPLGVTDALTAFGRRDLTVVMPGRFRATEDDGRGIQVLYDNLEVQSFHSDSDDWTPPRVGQVRQSVTATTDGGATLTVEVTSPDEDVAGVVVAVIEDLEREVGPPMAAPRWRSVDLGRRADGTFVGAVTLVSDCVAVDLLVQVYDTSGNVGVMGDKGAGFNVDCTPPTDPDPDLPPVPVLTAEPATTPGPSGWYLRGPVTIRVTSTAPGPFEYRIDGGETKLTEPAEGVQTFEVVGPGVRSYRVATQDGALVATGTVRIDDGMPPVVDITSPDVRDRTDLGEPFTVEFTCEDVSLASCEGVVTRPDGTSRTVLSGATVTPTMRGRYTIEVTGTDALGGSTTADASVDVARFEGFFSPLAEDDPYDPQVVNVVQSGRTVPLKWRLYARDGSELATTDGIDVSHRFVACSANDAVEVLPDESAPSVGGGLQVTDDGFQFNLRTQRSWRNHCGQLTVTYDDQVFSARFRYR